MHPDIILSHVCDGEPLGSFVSSKSDAGPTLVIAEYYVLLCYINILRQARKLKICKASELWKALAQMALSLARACDQGQLTR